MTATSPQSVVVRFRGSRPWLLFSPSAMTMEVQGSSSYAAGREDTKNSPIDSHAKCVPIGPPGPLTTGLLLEGTFDSVEVLRKYERLKTPLLSLSTCIAFSLESALRSNPGSDIGYSNDEGSSGSNHNYYDSGCFVMPLSAEEQG